MWFWLYLDLLLLLIIMMKIIIIGFTHEIFSDLLLWNFHFDAVLCNWHLLDSKTKKEHT